MLACGMYSGAVWLLDPLLLTPTSLTPQPFKPSINCVSHLAFSPESDFLAVAVTTLLLNLLIVTL